MDARARPDSFSSMFRLGCSPHCHGCWLLAQVELEQVPVELPSTSAVFLSSLIRASSPAQQPSWSARGGRGRQRRLRQLLIRSSQSSTSCSHAAAGGCCCQACSEQDKGQLSAPWCKHCVRTGTRVYNSMNKFFRT